MSTQEKYVPRTNTAFLPHPETMNPALNVAEAKRIFMAANRILGQLDSWDQNVCAARLAAQRILNAIQHHMNYGGAWGQLASFVDGLSTQRLVYMENVKKISTVVPPTQESTEKPESKSHVWLIAAGIGAALLTLK